MTLLIALILFSALYLEFCVFQVPDFMDTNPPVVNGERVFEGDIVLTMKQWRALKERKGLASSNSRWPEGADGYPLVPYRFNSGENLK